MNNIFLSLLLISLPVLPLSAQLSDQDRAIVGKCQQNIDPEKGQLSPVIAEECVKALNEGKPALINRYAEENAEDGDEAATKLIGHNNSLVSLNKLINNQSGFYAARGLERMLEGSDDCVPCQMKLGPKPETTFDWVGKYSSGRLGEVKRCVRTWDALGALRTSSLSSAAYGKDKGSWNGQGIMARYAFLTRWARAETDKLAAAAAMSDGQAVKPDYSAMVSVLREDLIFGDDAPYRAKLDAILSSASAKNKPDKPSVAEGKGKELDAANRKIKDMAGASAEDTGEYLSQAFDNTSKQAASAGKPAVSAGKAGNKSEFKPVQMTAVQEKELADKTLRMEDGKLKGYLADVMEQTAAGKRTKEFYEGTEYAKDGANKLNFGFTRAPGVFGYWSPNDKAIKINSEVPEEFAAKRNMTVEQMMKDPAAMKDFAVYVSPTGIHEPRHQKETAWAIANGIDYKKFPTGSSSPYTIFDENKANKEAVEHMMEYCAKNGGDSCYAKFNPMHVNNVEVFKREGLQGLENEKLKLYPRLGNYEEHAGKEFMEAQQYSSRLKELEARNKKDAAALDSAEKAELKSDREMMATRFKWYTMVYQSNAEAEREALAFRAKYSGAAIGAAVPPSL